MYRSGKSFPLAVVALCCLFCLTVWQTPGASAAGAYVQVKPADIPGMDAGSLLKLIASEKGKVVIVNIFASWCPPCREEVPGLVRVRKEFSPKDVLVIGVSVDKEPKALANFINALRVNYPVKLAEGDFAARVGVTAVPQLLIYDKSGELVVNHKGLVDEQDLNKAVKEILAE